MAQLRNIVGVVFIIALVFFFSVIVFIRLQGKDLILKKAKIIFNRPVTVDGVNYVFPTGLRLSNLNIEGVLFVENAQLNCGLSLFLGNPLALDHVTLDNAVLTLHRDRENHVQWNAFVTVSNGNNQLSGDNAPKPASRLQAVIRSLQVSSGKIIFSDHEQTDASDIYLTDIQIAARNVPLSNQDLQTKFQISGKILDNQSISTGNIFKGAGEFNWSRRNMNAEILVEQWRSQFDVNLKAVSVNNDMTVQCHMISRASHAKDNDNQNEDLLANIMKSASMDVDMNFSFATKMDRWELRNIDFSGNLSPSLAAQSATK